MFPLGTAACLPAPLLPPSRPACHPPRPVPAGQAPGQGGHRGPGQGGPPQVAAAAWRPPGLAAGPRRQAQGQGGGGGGDCGGGGVAGVHQPPAGVPRHRQDQVLPSPTSTLRFVALTPEQMKKIGRQEFEQLLEELEGEVLAHTHPLYTRCLHGHLHLTPFPPPPPPPTLSSPG